jgi:hypothetical protein
MPFAWFVQTFVFVLLNKVCTSQVRNSLYAASGQRPYTPTMNSIFSGI